MILTERFLFHVMQLPCRMDKLWAQEVLTWNGVSPPLCDANTVDRCMAPSDTLWCVSHNSTVYGPYCDIIVHMEMDCVVPSTV